MSIFDPRPSYRVASSSEHARLAFDLPLSPLRNFGEQVQQGAVDSFGLGTAIKDFSTPRGVDASSRVEQILRGTPAGALVTGYEAVRSLFGAPTTGKPMTLEEYKGSEFYRQEIPYDPGMTTDRAAALATNYDIRRAREYFGQKDMLTTLAGGFVGGAFDPINYVPVFGPGARAAAALKFGTVVGHALIGASEAAINTAVFGAITTPVRAKYGEDVSWQAAINNIAFSAIAGAVFGGIGGAVERARSLRTILADAKIKSGAETLANLRNSREVLNDAVASLVQTGDVRLSPKAQTVLERIAADVTDKRQSVRALEAETSHVTATKAGEVAIAPSGARVEVRPEVVDASTLQRATGALQVRDRSGNNAASQQQIEDIAINLDPARLMPNVDASQGSPIVGPDNIVDSGNGRVAALERVYEAYPDQAAAYRKALEDAGYDLTGIDRPILIARRVTPLSDAARAQFNADVNGSTTARLSAVELAAMDRNALTDSVLSLHATDAPITAAANRPFVARFLGELPQNERNALIDRNGDLTADGVRRIENALVAAAYGDVDAAALRKFAEATDDNTRAVVGALADVSGKWLAMRRAIQRGEISPDYDQTPELTEALRKLSGWREQAAREKRPVSIVIKEGMAQGDMLSGSLPAGTRLFVRTFYTSDDFTQAAGRETIGKLLGDLVDASMDLGQPDMLGDAYAATKLGVLQRVANDLETDVLKAPSVATRVDGIVPAHGGLAPGADIQGDRGGARQDGSGGAAGADARQALTARAGDGDGGTGSQVSAAGGQAAGLAEPPPDAFKSVLAYRGPSDASQTFPGITIADPERRYTDLVGQPEGDALISQIDAAPSVDAAHLVGDDWVLQMGREHGVEHLVAFDDKGGLISAGQGERSFVTFPDYLVEQMNRGRVRYATHNHPSDLGLSGPDLTSMFMATTAGRHTGGVDMTITAMGHREAKMSAAPGPAFAGAIDPNKAPNMVGVMLAVVDDRVHRGIWRLIDAQKITRDVASKTAAHVSNIVLHRLGLIDLRSNGADIMQKHGVDFDAVVTPDELKGLVNVARRTGFELADLRDFDRTQAPQGIAKPGAGDAGANSLPGTDPRAPVGQESPVRIRGRRQTVDPNQLILLEGGNPLDTQSELFGGSDLGRRRGVGATVDMQEPRPDPPVEGLESAAARVGKPEEIKALAEQFGVDETGGFVEEADIAALREQGRLTADDEAELAAADQTFADAEAWAETLRVAAACVMG